MMFFFFNDTATTEIYTLSLHDALPILAMVTMLGAAGGILGAYVMTVAKQRTVDIGMVCNGLIAGLVAITAPSGYVENWAAPRSEEHTSELQSRQYLVCRLLLEKKKIEL